MDLAEPERRVGRIVLLLLVAAVVGAVIGGLVVGRFDSPAEPSAGSEELGAALVMNVTGGIAGVDEIVIVRRSGAYVIDDGRKDPVRGVLSDRELAALNRAVRDADLDRRTRPGLDDVCCDRLHYTFSYGGRHYETISGEVPASVDDLVDALRALPDGVSQRFV